MMIESVFLLLMIIGNISWKGNCQTPLPDAVEDAAQNFKSTDEPYSTNSFRTPEKIRGRQQLLQDYLVPPPKHVTIDEMSLTPTSFRVSWDAPDGPSDGFDGYLVTLISGSSSLNDRMQKDDRSREFKELDPGQSYEVLVKSVLGEDQSPPGWAHVTLAPLPVDDLVASINKTSEMIEVSWTPHRPSIQDRFKLSYNEVGRNVGDTKLVIVHESRVMLEKLLPGRNHTIRVQSVSNQIESNESTTHQATHLASPISEDRKPVEKGLNISRNSKEDKFEISNETSTVRIRIIISTAGYGADYIVKVETISNRLSSEPGSEFEADIPEPSSKTTLEEYQVWFREWLEMATIPEVSDYTIHYRTEGNTTWQLLPKPSSRFVNATIDNVTPGERYFLRFYTVSYGVENSEYVDHHLEIPPNPVLTMNITTTSDSTNVILKWLRPKGRIETYVIEWRPVTNSADTRSKNVAEGNVIATGLKDSDQMREVLIDELISGMENSFSIHTVSYGVSSDVTNFKIKTIPEQVSGIRADDIGDTYMTLEWDIPRGHYDAFEVQYTSLNEMMEEIPMQNITYDTSMTITELRPYRNYSYTLIVISGNESTSMTRSKPVSAIFTTSESRPEQIVDFNTLEIRPTEITFEWSLPIEKQNGIIRRFSITYGVQGSTRTKVKSFEPNEFRGVIGSLTPAETYDFNIQAETIIGLGPAKMLQQRMPSISALPHPKPTDVPVKLSDSSTVNEVVTYRLVFPKFLPKFVI